MPNIKTLLIPAELQQNSVAKVQRYSLLICGISDCCDLRVVSPHASSCTDCYQAVKIPGFVLDWFARGGPRKCEYSPRDQRPESAPNWSDYIQRES